jgi:hypothetical protein
MNVEIHVNEADQVVSASLIGLGNNTGRDYVVEVVFAEAVKLLVDRAIKRRFRSPFKITFRRDRANDRIVFRGQIEMSDRRGRKARVGLELTSDRPRVRQR